MRSIEELQAAKAAAIAAHRALPADTSTEDRYASEQLTGRLSRELSEALDAGPRAFVVESLAGQGGDVKGVFRLYVATESRAIEVASQSPGRQWRAVRLTDVPMPARAGIERALGL